MRVDGRLANQLRPTNITPDYLITAEGSVLIEAGNTRVLCAATVEDSVPGVSARNGQRLGNGGIFDAAAVDHHQNAA